MLTCLFAGALRLRGVENISNRSPLRFCRTLTNGCGRSRFRLADGGQLTQAISTYGDGLKMNTQLARSRKHEEIRGVLSSISRELSLLGEEYRCILHCMQPHRRGYYCQLEQEFGVHALLCEHEDGIKAIITKAALGFAAVIEVERYSLIEPLFLRISEQALARLYVIRKSGLVSLANLARRKGSEIAGAVQADPTHLLYQVDEDSADSEGQILEIISVGPECPRSLSEAVASSGGIKS